MATASTVLLSLPPPAGDAPAAHVFTNTRIFADLLLRLPDRSTLNFVLAICENDPLMLRWTWQSLDEKGLLTSPRDDFLETLPVAEWAEHCPKLEEPPPSGEDRCRRLPCGHAFHESCLRHWFRVRTTCFVCGLDCEWKKKRKKEEEEGGRWRRPRGDTPHPQRRRRWLEEEEEEEEEESGGSGKLHPESAKEEIRAHLFEHHPSDASDWFHGKRGAVRKEDVRSSGPFDITKLLLKYPYRSTLKATLTLHERLPEVLMLIFGYLKMVGIPRDVASTLPVAHRIRNCPTLDLLHKKMKKGDEKEVGRFLACGHSFHETCLRYWFRVRKDCPVCRQKVNWNENMPPLLDGKMYAKRELDGMTIEEMQYDISKFLETYHFDFCDRLLYPNNYE